MFSAVLVTPGLGGLIGLLIVVLVGCVVVWAAGELCRAFGADSRVTTVVRVVVVLAVMLWVLGWFGVW